MALHHEIEPVFHSIFQGDHSVSVFDTGEIYSGKGFMLLARVPLYEEGGVPIRKVTVCFFLENICTLLGAAFVSDLAVLFPNDLLNDYKWMTIGLVILFLSASIRRSSIFS